ncbi:MAG: DUF1569 domain-containing protein [Candidatus Kapabacteria bacterium]|nr:DUF1569 domain-containing protein [Candidatus Kapabacteria bacterium]
MAYPSIFLPETHTALLARLDALTPTTPHVWGTMSPAQMLAHVNVSYEYTYGERSDVPPWFMRFILKTFLRPLLVGEKPYAKNSRTAPSMVMKQEKDFDAEMKRLKNYMQRIYDEGSAAWNNRKQVTLGVLTSEEWSNLYWKHMDHHLRQFGV